MRRESHIGKVNHFAANLRHFPLENIDFTSILAVFPGKVNQIATNPGHFPPTTFQYNGHRCNPIGLIRRESEPYSCEFTALSL